MRIFFTKDGDQHIGASHFFLAAGCGLHMHDGPLNYTLKTQGWLSINFIITRNNWCVVINEIFELRTKLGNINSAGLQNLNRCSVIQ